MAEMHPQDHDILIRLTEKVDNLIEKVNTLTDDHEKRIRSLEKYVWKALGALAIADAIIAAYLTVKH